MLPILIRTEQDRPPELAKRKHREFMREAHRAMGDYWQQVQLPMRFIPGASYPHKARSAKWLRRKRKLAEAGKVLFGGTVINVATGHMRDLLLAPGLVRGFPTRVTIRKRGPRYVTMRVYKSNQPHKLRELFELKRSEANELGRVFQKRYVEQMRILKKRQRMNS